MKGNSRRGGCLTKREDRGKGRDETMAYSPGFYDTSWFMLLQKTNCFLFAASQSLFGSIYLRIWWQQQLQKFLDTMRNIVAAMAYRHGSRSSDLMVYLVWNCYGTAQNNRLLTTKTWVRMAVLKAGWVEGLLRMDVIFPSFGFFFAYKYLV